jgi:predicted nuclease of predicted toxin-antitoxin system
MKLLVDMNLSPHWVRVLGEAGIDAVHWSAIGTHNAPDTEVMACASAQGYIVLTHDLDFGAILASTRNTTPSVVQIRNDNLDPRIIGNTVITALRQMASELDAGALVTVEPSRARLRLLPLAGR